VGSGEYSDPQALPQSTDCCGGIARANKRDVKADSITPASLKRGCPNLSVFCEGPRPIGRNIRFAGNGEAVSAQGSDPRSDSRHRLLLIRTRHPW
jgi:hypothetical protein